MSQAEYENEASAIGEGAEVLRGCGKGRLWPEGAASPSRRDLRNPLAGELF